MGDKKLFLPESIDEDEVSPLRQLIAQAGGKPHTHLRTLREAQEDASGVVILEGDDGGTIYVVCLAKLVRCSQTVLHQLLRDVDALVWREPESAHLYFESWPLGSRIPGGCGGGMVTEDVWVHDELQSMAKGILAVVAGMRADLNTPTS